MLNKAKINKNAAEALKKKKESLQPLEAILKQVAVFDYSETTEATQEKSDEIVRVAIANNEAVKETPKAKRGKNVKS